MILCIGAEIWMPRHAHIAPPAMLAREQNIWIQWDSQKSKPIVVVARGGHGGAAFASESVLFVLFIVYIFR